MRVGVSGRPVKLGDLVLLAKVIILMFTYDQITSV